MTAGINHNTRTGWMWTNIKFFMGMWIAADKTFGERADLVARRGNLLPMERIFSDLAITPAKWDGTPLEELALQKNLCSHFKH